MEKKKAGRKSKRPTKEMFEMMYKDMKAADLAAHFGVSTPTIYQWSMYFRNKGGDKLKSQLKKSLFTR